ncbi:MAG: NADH-quinone oxidoreductase subunit NuoH [Bacteroidia bacterium]|nr:NADH-quinone oxidoreductase subunit NuoH [Bacteroidia bacterium]
MELYSQILLIFPVLLVLITLAAYGSYAERRVAAAFQQRVGPNRVGPFGLLQPLADVLKLMIKEDVTPANADKLLHFLSPIISVATAMIMFGVIPLAKFGDSFLVISDVNIGILYLLGVTSVSVYGITLAGWASNGKYSLLGGLRASAQMISYELPLGLAVVSVIILTNARMPMGSDFLSVTSIVEAQRGAWNLFINPLGFIIFYICVLAESARTPFDLVEAEQELVGGFHTEYSSLKFGMFMVVEFLHLVIPPAIITTVFLGGYLGPFEGALGVAQWGNTAQILWGLGWFLTKTFTIAFTFMWIRWTLPRFKYNQLMDLGWKRLLPLALINLVVVAIGAAIYVFQTAG